MQIEWRFTLSSLEFFMMKKLKKWLPQNHLQIRGSDMQEEEGEIKETVIREKLPPKEA